MNLSWTRAARQDRDLIFAYVGSENLPAAVLLDERLQQRVAQLIELPNLGRSGRVLGTRELTVTGTSYLLVYRLTADTVWILRVIHTSMSWPHKTEQPPPFV